MSLIITIQIATKSPTKNAITAYLGMEGEVSAAVVACVADRLGVAVPSAMYVLRAVSVADSSALLAALIASAESLAVATMLKLLDDVVAVTSIVAPLLLVLAAADLTADVTPDISEPDVSVAVASYVLGVE
jgi:hypothetical protein